MGGYPHPSSTEMLDVDTMTWGIGPNLPFPNWGMKGVGSVSGSYLGFFTGGHGNAYSNKIYGLKKTGGNVYAWEEVHSMTTARSMHSVVNAPKPLLPNC